MSRLGRAFANRRFRGILLGDSGYPLLPWLMTPVINPDTQEHRAYNSAHVRTRVKIEMVNGQLKNKFQCLIGRGLNLIPSRACDVIVACCVLFNLHKLYNEPEDEDNAAIQPQGRPLRAHNDDDDEDDGRIARNEIINNFFV
eukprot:XP_003730494.1 PREDICTED: putative nuclease HARBI1 [Strongylocentrotus purpuratus]